MTTTTHEDVRKHVRIYLIVFGALLALTVVTVAVSYLHLSLAPAVVLALIVATAKGTLVALFFMHLSHEKKAIYAALALTALFFLFLMFIPLFTEWDSIAFS